MLAPAARRARRIAEEALARALREEAGGGLVAPPARFSARCCPRPTTTSCSSSPSGSTPASRARPAPRSPPGAGRAVAARPTCGAASTRRAARWRRGRWAVNGNGAGRGALATYRDLGSFQLLLSLQDDDALRLFCDSILAPIEEGEGAYGGELMRSLEAFIECNGQWERAATALLLSPSHAALPDPPRRGADRTRHSTRARDRIDFWLALRGRES